MLATVRIRRRDLGNGIKPTTCYYSLAGACRSTYFAAANNTTSSGEQPSSAIADPFKSSGSNPSFTAVHNTTTTSYHPYRHCPASATGHLLRLERLYYFQPSFSEFIKYHSTELWEQSGINKLEYGGNCPFK
jgi:hypothetical protein